MADAPNSQLPMLYNDLLPLSSKDHADWKVRPVEDAKFIVNQNAMPITTDEFIPASRFYPIVFSQGDNPVPLALMGLNEGINTAVDDDGKLRAPVYVPAYIRRYPFLFARLNPNSDEMSLCFDPTSKAIGKFKDGEKLFDKGEQSEALKQIITFCQQFEESGARTQNFMKELKDLDLLMEGEVSIQQPGNDQPFIYRGFLMVDEEKLRDMRGDALRKISQNGILPLLYAHLFSLQMMREIFAQQVALGKMPQVSEAPMPAEG
ncbi:SapC family protein [Sphingorhabdus soli]|uniref:SapC family protein n=1 Tax=Flavisphingopyxis soli TaxID=2601267 RepID=A0A5C6UAJ8_9SPHN|nr:SapC family protein [Sphingorhabdus soli]TXC68795.1 SapC family protein [Sphingorhabdus soli]